MVGILFFFKFTVFNVPLGPTEFLHSATSGRKLQCFQGRLQNMRAQTNCKSRGRYPNFFLNMETYNSYSNYPENRTVKLFNTVLRLKDEESPML